MNMVCHRKINKCLLSLILFICIFIFNTTVLAGKVDCRRYVFAPICRGVAAKRSMDSQRFNANHHRFSFPSNYLDTSLIQNRANKDRYRSGLLIEKLNKHNPQGNPLLYDQNEIKTYRHAYHSVS